MAGDSGTSFPVAGLAVVALFLSTAFLGPHGFDLLRQPESDAGKRVELSKPPVEARLWEDPLQALRRYNQTMKELCFDNNGAPRPKRDPHCEEKPVEPNKLWATLDPDHWTVIAAMLPGATMVGNEEARRRVRYAVLSGLGAAGYAADYNERLSILRVQRCPSFNDCKEIEAEDKDKNKEPGNKPTALASVANDSMPTAQPPPDKAPDPDTPSPMELVYETLSVAPDTGSDPAAKPRRAMVLWIDDSLLADDRWLTTLVVLLKDVKPKGDDARLRILGPMDSEGLAKALVNLADLRKKAPALAKKSEKAFQENWDVLAKLRLISPNSTAPDEQILKAAHQSILPQFKTDRCSPAGEWVEKAFDGWLEEIYNVLPAGKANWAVPRSSFLSRTIGTDDRLADQLVDELFPRGLDRRAAGPSRRVALISEWNSIYARTFAETLRTKLWCKSDREDVAIDIVSYHYLRGVDGSTVSGDPASNPHGADDLRAVESGRNASNARTNDRAALPVEWPEGGGQRDYLRRLAQRLGDANWRHPDTEVQAIGIIGEDVQDKLMIAQALRKTFQDRTIFTTDLDARLLHPAVTQYTRNLVVASSLPLAVPDEELQCGVPPFRDSYQTATFLAARIAAAGDEAVPSCGGLDASEIKHRVAALIGKPFLFEVTRDSAVELVAANAAPRTPTSRHEAESRITYALLAGVMFAMLGVVMVLGKPGPAMRAAWEWRPFGSPGAVAANLTDSGSVIHAGRSTVVVAGVEAAALGFAAGVAIELGAPGSVGPFGAILLGLAAATFFWAFLYPGTRWMQEFRAGRGEPARRWERCALQVLGFVTLFGVLWMAWVAPQAAVPDVHEPFDAFNGASAWPSQLLRTLVIVLFAWFLDFAWCTTESEADRLGMKYFPARRRAPAGEPTSRPISDWGRCFWKACRDATIWLWQPEAGKPKIGVVDGTGLWQDYRKLLRGRPRLLRVVLWLSIAIGLVLLVFALIGGAMPENPTRGIADRQLVAITLILSSVAVIFLLVLVGDATVLTWRFIVMLKSGRTRYRPKALLPFAAELGSEELRELAARRIAALPVDRGTAGGRNTLLDDWIDARLLGELTATVGPLIIFPFVLVALMIVARSPLFDNWQVSPSILTLFGGFMLGTLAMAALLNWGAEKARRRAVERMEADLLWFKGAGSQSQSQSAVLAAQFPLLIDQVKNMRQGAFAPLLEQPLVRALMVPLGGAGGIQLVQYLLLGS